MKSKEELKGLDELDDIQSKVKQVRLIEKKENKVMFTI